MGKFETVLVVSTQSRIDQLLLPRLQEVVPTLSRGAIKSWFTDGKVLWNGRTVAASHLLSPGEHAVEVLDWDPSALGPAMASPSRKGPFLPVVFEDDELLVLHKSSGTPSVPHSAAETETAVGAALAHFPGLVGIGRGGLEPGILHRLDTSTSGLLAFAKTPESYDFFHALWAERKIRKFYRALSVPSPKYRDEGPRAIATKLAHDAQSLKKMRVVLSKDDERRIRGKPLEALTRLLETSRQGDWIEARVEIETGVMHQIRAHLASVGLPLLGDTLYGGAPSPRIWLHAERLELPLPNGAKLVIRAALPEGWPVE